MTEDVKKDGAWDDAIAEASAHVQERGAAAEEAAEKSRPRDQRPLIIALSVLLLASASWAAYRFQAPAEEIPINEDLHLAWFVVDAAEAVDDFAAESGRLPSEDEATALLDESITYVRNDAGYELRAFEGDRSVEYSSSLPIDQWLAARFGSSEE